MTQAIASNKTAMLAGIWQQVLHKESVALDENFFTLGGTLCSADLLFAQIAREFGRDLPSATIYHAQTVEQLARHLEELTLPKFTPLVSIKPGVEPPLFIVHGLAGTVPFFNLAQQIQTDNSVIGIAAKGIDGLEDPYESVESMAALYQKSVQELQPKGPYLLAGYSFGGLVALEMAQRLTAVGEKVALLVLIDAYPDSCQLSSSQRLRLTARRARRHLVEPRRLRNRLFSYGARGLDLGRRVVGMDHADHGGCSESRLSFARATALVKDKAYVALAHYCPRFYGGEIKFIKSKSDSYFPADPAAVWSKWARQFEFESVPGSHLDMMTTDFSSLAEVLTRYVQKFAQAL